MSYLSSSSCDTDMLCISDTLPYNELYQLDVHPLLRNSNIKQDDISKYHIKQERVTEEHEYISRLLREKQYLKKDVRYNKRQALNEKYSSGYTPPNLPTRKDANRMTIDDFNIVIKRLGDKGYIFQSEEIEYLRYLRRLITNREYARSSRLKKKIVYDELVEENDKLREEITSLRKEIHYLNNCLLVLNK